MTTQTLYLTSPLPKQRRTLSSITLSPGVSRNSSVWAEDYFDADTEIDFQEGGITPPPAAATTARPFPRSVPISADEESYPARQPRTHTRSLTALLPFLPPTKSRSNSNSPERKQKTPRGTDEDFMATLTGDREGVIKVEDKNRGLSSWFTGSSAPVAVGVSVAEQEAPMTSPRSREPSPERAKLRKRPTLQSTDSTPSKSANTSRFSFFSSPKSPPPPSHLPPAIENDEFLNLDIHASLFPNGDSDPFSPSAFKNLLTNAQGLLSKLQTAYKIRTISLHELSAEREAQNEELEEAQTRNQCFKSQIQEMARRVEEQDRAMADLVLELAREKEARAEEREAREKSIALVRASREQAEKRASCRSPDGEGEEEGDLGIHTSPRREKWRGSIASLETAESDNESRESVFSRSRSPTTSVGSSAASTMTDESAPEIAQASYGRVITLQSPNKLQRPRPVTRQSTFQKMLSGVTGSGNGEIKGIGLEDGCANCQGREASVAWDTVGLLRAENKGLKDRVGELEGAVDVALDMCSGLRL